MKYLCLAYEEEKKLNALSRSEWDLLRNEILAYVETLRNSGHLGRPDPRRGAGEVPGMGRLCLFTDPEGRMLGLWKGNSDGKSS